MVHGFGWHFNVLKALRNWRFDSLPKMLWNIIGMFSKVFKN
jgi:hypothetical protein